MTSELLLPHHHICARDGVSPSRRAVITSLVIALLATITVHAAAPSTLRFSVPDGRVLNEFYRQGPVAAHLVLTSGAAPRLVIAFPAGNSGLAVWFDARSAALAWYSDMKIEAAQRQVPGGVLHGVSADLVATGGPVRITQVIASSVRVIREYQDGGQAPAPQVRVAPRVSRDTLVWERRRLDGAPGYYLSFELLDGRIVGGDSQPIELHPDASGRMRVHVTALTGDTPLTPLSEDQLLLATAAPDARLRRMLAFLSYEEKLLAGSWRFNTYFGRDTLMSLRLLAPVLQPGAVEAGLGAVLERLNAAGEVAHEEDVGEYAVLRRLQHGLPLSDTPILDYKMIDDDFMLAIVAAHYLLDTPAERAREFLARKTAAGASYGAAVVRNFRFVIDATEPFAREPGWQRLIALKAGESAGNWRDSQEGLGGGRYPYDVNGVLAPAALAAIGRLRASGLLEPYLDAENARLQSAAGAMAQVWLREAPALFDVVVPPKNARALAQTYAHRVGVDPAPAGAALAAQGARFRGVALDAQGRPVPILNSDEGFALLLASDAPEQVERIVDTLMRPFPAGLLTDVGLLVANPAYAPDPLQPAFDRSHYHGSVVWSWQQALLAAGIERQLGRDDLTGSARATLERARARLRTVMGAGDAVRGSELWSWSQVGNRYHVEPFGQRAGDVTESNAAQLWSTVQLARPPL